MLVCPGQTFKSCHFKIVPAVPEVAVTLTLEPCNLNPNLMYPEISAQRALSHNGF